jgi:tRNA threonylcarbamoyladenosine biosynthesis protein TsaE
MEFTIDSAAELPKLAEELIRFCGDHRLVAFEGEMGAGKTTFIKSICNALGVKDVTSSPTFSIVNQYSSGEGKVYHFDFYRLSLPEEALGIGVEEYFSDGSWCLMEWPERIGNLLPSDHVKVRLEPLSPTQRHIVFQRP